VPYCATCNSKSFDSSIQKIISINPDQCWLNDYAKEALIFHELGHCILGRDHDNGVLPNGDPKRMMIENNIGIYAPCVYAIGGDHSCNFIFKRDYYISELFADETAIPFVTEENPIGAFLPEQSNRTDMFNFIENELLDIEAQLVAPMQNEYARVDQAAAWMLLSKLYLNAGVYINADKNTEAITYTKKVIDAGYTLSDSYAANFMADNHNSPEIIFAVAFDGLNTQTYGGTTFITHAAVGGDMSTGDFGVDSGWGGTRTTSAFVNKFEDTSGDTDARALFLPPARPWKLMTLVYLPMAGQLLNGKMLINPGHQVPA
jgi:hypothetical protein